MTIPSSRIYCGILPFEIRNAGKILKQVQDDMTILTNVQCVVLPLLFARNKRRCGLCLRKDLQPLLAHQDDMTSLTNVQSININPNMYKAVKLVVLLNPL